MSEPEYEHRTILGDISDYFQHCLFSGKAAIKSPSTASARVLYINTNFSRQFIFNQIHEYAKGLVRKWEDSAHLLGTLS